jgi:type I restriction enzyme R subunit
MGDPEEYERGIIDDFSEPGAPDILIVVDKLLTGFDEPRNAVLYIDKPLKAHNIIQAIAAGEPSARSEKVRTSNRLSRQS